MHLISIFLLAKLSSQLKFSEFKWRKSTNPQENSNSLHQIYFHFVCKLPGHWDNFLDWRIFLAKDAAKVYSIKVVVNNEINTIYRNIVIIVITTSDAKFCLKTGICWDKDSSVCFYVFVCKDQFSVHQRRLPLISCNWLVCVFKLKTPNCKTRFRIQTQTQILTLTLTQMSWTK